MLLTNGLFVLFVILIYYIRIEHALNIHNP